MYIAICDDDLRMRSQLAEMIQLYAAARSLPMQVQAFDSAEAMLRAAAEKPFTHYFLDVMMPGMDGISAAQEIRRFDEQAKLVFLSSFTEYAYQGFQVRAYDYLLKPLQPQTLSALLDRLAAEENSVQACFSIQSGRSLFRLPYDHLAYLEVIQKRLYFHLTDGQVRQFPGTMTSMEAELLSQPDFVKTHRAYIVNLSCVSSISPEGCILLSGESLPISRLLYQQVHQAYMAYLFSGAKR